MRKRANKYPAFFSPDRFFLQPRIGLQPIEIFVAEAVPSADLAKIFRGNPPDEPERFYRLTRDGHWLRRSNGNTFLEVKTERILSRGRAPRRVHIL